MVKFCFPSVTLLALKSLRMIYRQGTHRNGKSIISKWEVETLCFTQKPSDQALVKWVLEGVFYLILWL